MRVGLFAAGCLTYLGGLNALISARDSVLNPPDWLRSTPGEIPTTGMLILFVLVVVPGVVLVFLGMVLRANPRYRLLDILLAIVGLAVLLGSSVVLVYN